jgi:hypothetical protein
MHRALWLLLWLRFRAWLRRLSRSAGTVRGALFLVAGLFFFALVIGPNVVLHLMQADRNGGPLAYVEHTRRVGPLLLFAYCALTVLFASAEQGISFTAAEVQFLFSGPFSRRQVLAYKITGNALLACLYALFLTGFFFIYAARPPAAYPGLVLTLWFIQFFSMAVSLVINTAGARAFSWWRRLVLVCIVALVTWWAARVGGDAFSEGPRAVVTRLQDNEVVQTLLTPMRWFVETFTAERLWPDFVMGAARCLAVDAGLLLLVFLLDAQYLEASAAASERAYARLQRVRSGGAMAAAAGTGRPRVRLPSLPYWGGVGPLAWRQLTTAARSLRPVLVFLVVFMLMVGGTRLGLGAVREGEPPLGGWLIGSTVLGMTVAMLTPLLTFDFRGDVDRMDVLKALPLAPWRLALGQLLAPTLVLSAVQLVVLAFVQVLWGGVEILLLGVLLFGPSFNFLSFGLENLIFLWFPTRPTPAAPGDFHMMGRQTLMMLAKFAALSLVILPAALAGTLAYVLVTLVLHVNGLPAGLAAGWLVLTGLSFGVVPLVASAFRRFDVARDTPP